MYSTGEKEEEEEEEREQDGEIGNFTYNIVAMYYSITPTLRVLLVETPVYCVGHVRYLTTAAFLSSERFHNVMIVAWHKHVGAIPI